MDSLFKVGTHSILQITILTFKNLFFIVYTVSYFLLHFTIFREIIVGTRPPFRDARAQQQSRTERHTVWIIANGISLMACSKFEEHWNSRYQSHKNTASMTSLGIV